MTNDEIYKNHLTMVNQRLTTIVNRMKLSIGEFTFLLSFLVNFVVGKIIHFTSQEEEVYNYYNDKNNIFNQLFVKKGWFWTTFTIVIFYGCLYYQNHPKLKDNKRKVLQSAIINYIITTIWWILFTQWCFGLPIMDKIFVWTGGKCWNIHPSKIKPHHLSFFTKSLSNEIHELYESNVITSSTCRRLKGQWAGGHDPSGHVFLLIHLSLYLFFEIKQFWPGWNKVIRDSKKLIHDLRMGSITIHSYILNNPSLVIIWLIALWWFMLLMTNIYFHSILEKFVGLLFGYCIVGLYIYPRFL